jgi:uncharacterized protein (TIGR01244 family)
MRQLDGKVMVSGQISPGDIPALRDHGVTMIVNNRPDDEEPGQPAAAEIKQAAEAAGIQYRFIPIARGIGPADADAMREALGATEGKVLAFCKAGSRSTYLWAVAQGHGGRPREEIERAAAEAGHDIAPVLHLL